MRKTSSLSWITTFIAIVMGAMLVPAAASAAPGDFTLELNEYTADDGSDRGSLHVAVRVAESVDLTGKLLMVAVLRGACEDETCREAYNGSIFQRAGLPEGRYFAALGTPEIEETGVYGVRMGGFQRSVPAEGVEPTSLQGWVFACDDKETVVLPVPPLTFTLEPGLILPDP